MCRYRVKVKETCTIYTVHPYDIYILVKLHTFTLVFDMNESMTSFVNKCVTIKNNKTNKINCNLLLLRYETSVSIISLRHF